MTREEAEKKYQAHDDALSPKERAKAVVYRRYSHLFLNVAWLSPILLGGLGSTIGSVPSMPTLQSWMILIGVTLCVVGLGLHLIFGGKDAVLRKYSLGQVYTTYSRPLFGDAAVRWGRTKIVTGYSVVISFALILLSIVLVVLVFPH